MRVHRIFANGVWLLLDKVSKLFIGLVVIAKVAQHLGPTKFGIWNYCIALTTIVGVLSTLGLEKIVVKELISNPLKRNEIIATSIFLRILASLLSLVICIGIVYFAKEGDIYLYCTFILSLTMVLQGFDVYDYYYQSQYLNKRTIIPRIVVFIIFSGIRILYIHHNLGLISFVWLSFWELFITYFIIILIFLCNYDEEFTLFGNLRFKQAANLISQSWPLIFTSLAVIIYMKIDQVMLDILSNSDQLGQYVAAARLSELWYAIPTVIAAILLPGLVKLKSLDKEDYHTKIEIWFRFSLWLSFIISLGITIISSKLIHILYGGEYRLAAKILQIHIWASVPVFLGIVISEYLVIDGSVKINLYATIIAAVMNIALNFILIPFMGAKGAAITNLISQATVFIGMLFLYRSKKLLFPLRFFNPIYIVRDIRYLKKVLLPAYKKLFFMKVIPDG